MAASDSGSIASGLIGERKANASTTRIVLAGKLGLPKVVSVEAQGEKRMPQVQEENVESSGDDSVEKSTSVINPDDLCRRKKNETAEEKRARKQKVSIVMMRKSIFNMSNFHQYYILILRR